MKKIILLIFLVAFLKPDSFSQGKKKGHYKRHHKNGKRYHKHKHHPRGATVHLPPRPPLPPLPPPPPRP